MITQGLIVILGYCLILLIHFQDMEKKDEWTTIRIKRSTKLCLDDFKKIIKSPSISNAISVMLQREKVMPHNQRKELMMVRNFKGQAETGIFQLAAAFIIFFFISALLLWIGGFFVTILPTPPTPFNTIGSNFWNTGKEIIGNSMLIVFFIIAIIELVKTYLNPSIGKAIRGIIELFILSYMSLVMGFAFVQVPLSIQNLMPGFWALISSNYFLAIVFFMLLMEIILNFRKPTVKSNTPNYTQAIE